LYNHGHGRQNYRPAAIPPPAAVRASAMNIQCPGCGHVQEYDPDYKICLNCGGPMDESNSTILKDPRKGRDMQGLAIIAFLLFVFVFFFWSKYIGRHGMAVSALFGDFTKIT
jgi:uncharacterized membrane protein YvbJ